MNEIDDGGPAFPNAHSGRGMSLRDWFAGQALNALMSRKSRDVDPVATYLAEIAYEQADAMIAERKKRKAE